MKTDMLIKQLTPIALKIFAIFIIVFFLYKFLQSKKRQYTIDESKLTYPRNQYLIFADAIQAATEGSWGDDEDAIYDVFEQMQTNDDVYALMEAFGNRSYISPPGIFYNATLTEVLNTKLDEDELNHINNDILATKGITVRI